MHQHAHSVSTHHIYERKNPEYSKGFGDEEASPQIYSQATQWHATHFKKSQWMSPAIFSFTFKRNILLSRSQWCSLEEGAPCVEPSFTAEALLGSPACLPACLLL